MATTFRRLISLFLALGAVCTAGAQLRFSSLDSVLSYADRQSLTIRSVPIKQEQAKKAKLAALLGIPDVTGDAYFSHTNNMRLPVSLFPSEVFGDPPGSFRQIEVGIQYVTTVGAFIDVKLINPAGWENFKLSKINIDLTETDALTVRKSIYENIATVYFNIVNLQEQQKAIRENLSAADTLQRIVRNKYESGIAKQQDVNDTRVSFLDAEERSRQCDYLLRQQYLALKILADIPSSDSIRVDNPIETTGVTVEGKATYNDLPVRKSRLDERIAWHTYSQSRLGLLPTLSVFAGAYNNQYNTKSTWFDRNVDWIPNNYVGIRLNVKIPSASQVAQVYRTKYNHQLSLKNLEQSEIRTVNEFERLGTDYEKAVSQYMAYKNILALRRDSYQKNLMAYREGIIPLDETIQSFNDMVNANYNTINSGINILLAQARIDINNKIK